MIDRFSLPVDTRAPTGATNAYVHSDGVVVDAAAHSDELDEAAADADHVVVTHHHPDHVGAVADYATEFDLTVWARYGRTAEFEAATSIAPDRTFGPGEFITSDVRAMDTPGHASEHTAFVTPSGIVSGDLAVAEGSVVVGAHEGDMRAYCSSLRRVIARAPERLFPGHGPVIDDPVATCRRLLAHRLDRERRVEAAVRDGARTLAAITDAAYDKDLEGVRDLAEATVAAHLEKLAVEGRVRWDDQRATTP